MIAGLTYKPDVDDFRESPALRIAEQVAERMSQKIIGVDPFVEKLIKERNVAFELKSELILVEKTLVAVLVRHRQFGAALSDIENVNGVILMDFCTGSGKAKLTAPPAQANLN